jgi:hypothetical protein
MTETYFSNAESSQENQAPTHHPHQETRSGLSLLQQSPYSSLQRLLDLPVQQV